MPVPLSPPIFSGEKAKIMGAVAEFAKNIIKRRAIVALANARCKDKRLDRPVDL
jgi:DNA invertase Pin-like site-specific DNA recombinase